MRGFSGSWESCIQDSRTFKLPEATWNNMDVEQCPLSNHSSGSLQTFGISGEDQSVTVDLNVSLPLAGACASLVLHDPSKTQRGRLAAMFGFYGLEKSCMLRISEPKNVS